MSIFPSTLLIVGAFLAVLANNASAQDEPRRVPPKAEADASARHHQPASPPQPQAVPRSERLLSIPKLDADGPVEMMRRSLSVPRSESPAPAPGTNIALPDGRRARPTATQRWPSTPPPVHPLPAPASPEAVPDSAVVAEQAQPRGDSPPVGRAVPRPRGERPGDADWRRRDRDRDRRGSGIVYVPRSTYYNYYYYPRRYYPYGYGAFGLGYFYYDPYSWHYDPYSWSSYGYYPYSYGYYPGRAYDYYDRGYRYAIGHLRIDVSPKHAEVFVDGYYAGLVDDFDGVFQSLDLEADGYRIEIRAPGFETLEFDIRILPGRKITYRGALRRLP